MRRRENKFPQNGFEAWGGYMQAKISKLEEQFDCRTGVQNESNLFAGISIFVNGYTQPSADELKIIMSKHGGVYHVYQRPDDYVIATNLPDFKVKKLSTTKIVKPEWIADSLTANTLLDYKQYLLYSKHTHSQPRLQFNIANTTNSTSSDQALHAPPKGLLNNKEDSASELVGNARLASSECTASTDLPGFTKTGNIDNKLNAASAEDAGQIKQKSDTKESARTATDPNFLSEFYRNSRLHHISQLGATFKQYVNDLREESDFAFPARAHLKEAVENMDHPSEPTITYKDFEGGKLIMHIDMDCFFVSVGLRSRPELRGQPVAVTHARGRRAASRPGVGRQTEFNLYRQRNAKSLSKALGVSEDMVLEDGTVKSRVDGLEEDDGFNSLSEIASCSYEARAMGVHNGMFMGAALRLCPDLKTIPYDFEGYKEVAYALYNTITQYTLDVEAVSCDELYADCTQLARELNAPAPRLARALRSEIRRKTGCPCSAGFGGNRLQARLATRRAKPDGQFFLTADLLDSFMVDVKLADLPGVGRQLLQRVAALCGDAELTCGALRPLSLATMQRQLGAAAGSLLYNYCRGRDRRPLTYHTVRKSVSAEVNYGIRLENEEQLETFLKQLCGEVHARLLKSRVLAKCVTLKMMVRAENAPRDTAKFLGHGFCDTLNKSSTLPTATDDLHIITREVFAIRKRQNVEPKEMRGLGIQLTKLESTKDRPGAIESFFQSRPIKPSGSEHQDTSRKQTKIPVSKNDENSQNGNLKVESDILRRTTLEESSNKVVLNDARISKETKPNCLSEWFSRTPTKNRPPSNESTPIKAPVLPKLLKKSPTRSPQKSPHRKKTLGLTRRRGRPPKIAAAAKSGSKTVMHKFLAGERTRIQAETLDPEILAALPDDIRQEVLEYYHPLVIPTEYSRPATPCRPTLAKYSTPITPCRPAPTEYSRPVTPCQPAPTEYSRPVTPCRTALIEPSRPATPCYAANEKSKTSTPIKPDLLDIARPQLADVIDSAESIIPMELLPLTANKSSPEVGIGCDSSALSWRQTRSLMSAWLARGTPPADQAALISAHMQRMVVDRRIDCLQPLINYLKRNVRQMQDSGWYDIYQQIVEGVQETMVAVYGKPLFID